MRKIPIAICLICLIAGCGGKTGTEEPHTTEMPHITREKTGMFITKIMDTDPARVNNIRICAEAISGTRIAPGGEFSFNRAVGERTEEKGYQEATILVEGKRDKAVGGGVCQVSSTLYNAAVSAGMEITERHDHTGDVHYVEPGKDAAVCFGEQDFKFTNSSETMVEIMMTVADGEVMAEIYRVVM